MAEICTPIISALLWFTICLFYLAVRNDVNKLYSLLYRIFFSRQIILCDYIIYIRECDILSNM